MKRKLKLAILTSAGVLALCGCATLVDKVVDRALDHAKIKLVEEVGELVRELVDNQSPASVPELGAPWMDYLTYFGTALGASGLILVDRRWFHNKRK